MKTIYKFFAITCLSVAVCLFLAIPAQAQRGGGGHGGGGGGHVGGGGFSGGHVGSFSGGRSTTSSSGSSSRSGFAPRSGFSQGSRAATGARGYTGSRGYSGYGRAGYGIHGHGNYGHGGWGRAYPWGRHGGYFYGGGFYASLYYPYLGLGFGYLPFGYYPFYWGADEYYFSNGLYYQYNDDQYTVVEPPVGAMVNSLPSNAQSVLINGQQYYELNGVYYSPVKKDDGTIAYQIAGKDGTLNTDANGQQTITPQIGNIVTTLPPDCRKVTLNGKTFFVSEDGIYYQETTDGNNNRVYKIVGLESQQGDN